MSDDPSSELSSWSARFGWIAGGVGGFIAGVLFTLLYEWRVYGLTEHSAAAMPSSVKLVSRMIIPLCFVLGAWGGHAFGQRAGARRYKLMGMLAGIFLTVMTLAVLMLSR